MRELPPVSLDGGTEDLISSLLGVVDLVRKVQVTEDMHAIGHVPVFSGGIRGRGVEHPREGRTIQALYVVMTDFQMWVSIADGFRHRVNICCQRIGIHSHIHYFTI